jgi:hypothetical protein
MFTSSDLVSRDPLRHLGPGRSLALLRGGLSEAHHCGEGLQSLSTDHQDLFKALLGYIRQAVLKHRGRLWEGGGLPSRSVAESGISQNTGADDARRERQHPRSIERCNLNLVGLARSE